MVVLMDDLQRQVLYTMHTLVQDVLDCIMHLAGIAS